VAAAEAQAHIASILRNGRPVDDVSRADAALVGLAAVGRVRTVISREDRRRHGDRIEAMTDRLGTMAPGLAHAARRLERTMVAAQGGMG
jgi:hypothetical protein